MNVLCFMDKNGSVKSRQITRILNLQRQNLIIATITFKIVCMFISKVKVYEVKLKLPLYYNLCNNISEKIIAEGINSSLHISLDAC